MVLEIVMYGDPVLRKKCARVEKVDDEIRELSENMIETMIAADGVGLAAPQIGVPIQLAVVDVAQAPDCISYLLIDGEESTLEEAMPLIFINPDLEFAGEKDTDVEGCLSFPELRADITRPFEVVAKLELLDGKVITVETDGLLARAIQHETDHLNGVLFIDRMTTAKKMAMRGKLKRLQQATKDSMR